ncbi:MAG: hypothetical protein WBG48_02975 [Pricia sp.]
MDTLRNEITRLAGGIEKEVDEIYDNLTLTLFEKGDFLLKQGHLCDQKFEI